MGELGSKASTGLCVAGAVLVVGAAVAMWFAVRPHLEAQRRLQRQRDELALRVARERAEVDELNSRSLRFETDPEFVEHEARKNHRIFTGETEFVFDAPE